MSFNTGASSYNPGYVSQTPLPPAYTPTKADSTVLMAGLAGLRPSGRPELSNKFQTSSGGTGGLGRKPATSKRALIGGT